MTPAEFLRAVWPSQGYYALAYPFKAPDGNVPYSHKVFDTIDAAAAYVAQNPKKDTFFAVHSLKQTRVWNPEKIDPKTGEAGAYEQRTHANMLQCKSFYLDIDVGADKPYATQGDAVAALKVFVKDAALPAPMLVSSGGGIHVYWLLTESISSEDWLHAALKLKQLTKHHQLKADPARTSDRSSVLRVAGTNNMKDPANPREVRVYHPGKVTPTAEFLQRIENAIIAAGVTITQPRNPALDALGSNTEHVFDGPPISFKSLVTACAQMQRIARLRGNVSEPEWYQSLNLVRYVANHNKFVHLISSGHPSYTPEETDKKIAQLEGKSLGPTTCEKLAEVCENDICSTCPQHGKVKSPLVAARRTAEAPAPVVAAPANMPDMADVTLPPPPYPYLRLESGGIAVKTKTASGDEDIKLIYKNDLYPIRRLVGIDTERHVWRVHLPRSGEHDFAVDADALYDTRKFSSTLANQGVFPHGGSISDLKEYMIAYINELQRLADAEKQQNHLGWDHEYTQFAMPDKLFIHDGTLKPTSLSLGASRASAEVHKKGTFERQVELLRFYEHDHYIPNQFSICAALGSPIFFATGHHGVIINMSGPPGASKSTTLYTGASMWGHPERYPLNGTNNGSTVKARAARVATLANLPVLVDEITLLPLREAADLAMGITQPNPGRVGLTVDGIERKTVDSNPSTIMQTTANVSLTTLLSSARADSTAEAMRVFEMQFSPSYVHTKPEADEYLDQLKQNYGHIGEVFMHYVVMHVAEVRARVREVMREIDVQAKIQSSERFWSAAAATSIVACEIASKLGLLNYKASAIKSWLLEDQLPAMRGVVIEHYNSPVGVLAEYLSEIHNDILIISSSKVGNISNIIKQPQRQLLARYELDIGQLWFLKKPFRDYCIRIGANYNKVLNDLHAARSDKSRVLWSKHTRKVLGAGTEFPKAQAWCAQANMQHPEISGLPDLVTADPNPVTKAESRRKPTVVTLRPSHDESERQDQPRK